MDHTVKTVLRSGDLFIDRGQYVYWTCFNDDGPPYGSESSHSGEKPAMVISIGVPRGDRNRMLLIVTPDLVAWRSE